MGRQRRRRYSSEFKAEAVRMVEDSDRGPTAVARRLGISASMLNRWCRDHERAEQAPAEGQADEAEVRRLRQRVRELEQEREILKKATAFFARESD